MFVTSRWVAAFPAACGDDLPTLHVRAPGRVNLIGEHTDYNDGFVLPVATEQALHVLAGPRGDRQIHVASAAFSPQSVTLDLDALPRDDALLPAGALPSWSRTPVGVAALLAADGVALRGANLLIDGDLPIGAGLSSSAALEVGVALALAVLAESPLDPRRIADLCREAENRYAGTPCGIMDQYACLFSRADHALLLDCRDRAIEHVPFPVDDLVILIIDTQVRHELAAGEYAKRVEQCARGVRHFASFEPHVRSLRDVTMDDLRAHGDILDPIARNRCQHVIEENARVHAFIDALRRRDMASLSNLMFASHASLRDLHEVSCPELDAVVNALRDLPGVFGARMTGGGFGGCVVALAHPDARDAVGRRLVTAYDPCHEKPALVRATRPAAGAAVVACAPSACEP